MANLAIIDLTEAGATHTTAAAAGGGDTITPAASDGRDFALFVNNGGGSPITVTIDDPTSTSPTAATAYNPDQAVTVTNGTAKMIRIRTSRALNTSTGLISITYSGVTTVTVAAYRLP
jgi:hypothetical protein